MENDGQFSSSNEDPKMRRERVLLKVWNLALFLGAFVFGFILIFCVYLEKPLYP